MRNVYKFTKHIEGKAVTKEIVISYKTSLIQNKFAIRSINSMLASVNCLLGFWGWDDCKVKTIKIQTVAFSPEEKELTKSEYIRLVSAVKALEMKDFI